METSDEPGRAILHQIAAALGVPVERLFSNPRAAQPAATADECLRLWSEIATEEGRQRALGVLRMIADQERWGQTPE